MCRVACKFCLLYDDNRWQLKSSADKPRYVPDIYSSAFKSSVGQSSPAITDHATNEKHLSPYRPVRADLDIIFLVLRFSVIPSLLFINFMHQHLNIQCLADRNLWAIPTRYILADEGIIVNCPQGNWLKSYLNLATVHVR